ncbi:MipA/OmpV family protein [Novosphingobium sp. B 225]|uniref:MipA/OmpV family protein n=1 Tax=Novosphingobium sp. B 225 TaxID=1961849 RepID=UPI000B4B0CD2|nr:MipA/OmpV family protein [Novosphingobium sp. B 225]
MPRATIPLCLAALLAAAPALAQTPDAAGPPAGLRDDGGDRLTIGFGLGAAPDYEGSDDYRLQPGGILQGRVAGIEFQMRGLNLYTDVLRDAPGARTRLVLGPVAQVRLDRGGDIADPRVAALGDRKTAVELGLTAGISQRGILIPPASLSFDVTWLRDVAGSHRSHIITPALALSSPVSARGFARLGISADFVGKGFAQSYFDVAPGHALTPYATRGGGHKSTAGSLLYTHDLGGEPRKGWGLFMLANYKRLHGQFARSPVVSTAGSANQAFAVAGLSYSL